MINTVKIGETVEFGSGMLGLIAGPCVIEGRDQCLRIAVELVNLVCPSFLKHRSIRLTEPRLTLTVGLA